MIFLVSGISGCENQEFIEGEQQISREMEEARASQVEISYEACSPKDSECVAKTIMEYCEYWAGKLTISIMSFQSYRSDCKEESIKNYSKIDMDTSLEACENITESGAFGPWGTEYCKRVVYDFKNIRSYEDLGKCISLNSGKYTETCNQYYAINNNNATHCDLLKNKDYKEQCLTTILIDRVYSEGELQECIEESLRIKRSGDICYYNYASYTNDFSICEPIQDTHIKGRCYHHYAIVTNDFSTCVLIEETVDKGLCYFDYADYSKNPTLCNFINDSLTRDLCYSTYVDYSGDTFLCALIDDTYLKKNCVEDNS